jgi:phosphomannomutase
MEMEEIKFGTDGWRGIIAADFTFANLAKVTQAIANYLLKRQLADPKLVIGYDNRFLSEKFAEKSAEVLAGNGIKVLLSQAPLPTPATAYMVKHTAASGALMITASHNPYYYNGIKFISEHAGPADPGITTKIEEELKDVQLIREEPLDQARARGLITSFSARDAYFKQLDSLIDRETIEKAGLRIAINCLYGASIGYIDHYLAGITEISVLCDIRNPLFGNNYPDPVQENLGSLKNTVQDTGAALGIAFDGDGDRFGIIDEQGIFYSPNRIFALLLPYFLETRRLGGPVYRTVATTGMIDRIAQAYGLPTVETPVGFKYIAKGFIEQDAVFGAEESGGMSVKGHIPEKDGILASLLVVEMLAGTGKTLSQLYEENSRKYGSLEQERIDLKVTPGEKQRILKLLKDFEGEKLGQEAVQEIIDMDGKKIIFADKSWCLIRPSGTEDVLRIYWEASGKERIRALQNQVLSWLQVEGGE